MIFKGILFPQVCPYNKCFPAHLPLLMESTLWPQNKCYLVKAPVCSSCVATVVFEPSSAPQRLFLTVWWSEILGLDQLIVIQGPFSAS